MTVRVMPRYAECLDCGESFSCMDEDRDDIVVQWAVDHECYPVPVPSQK